LRTPVGQYPFVNFAGTIKRQSLQPIYASIANVNEYANYTFTFMTETDLAPGGQLLIIFPSQDQYVVGLGLTTTPQCNIKCAVSGHSVFFTYETGLAKNKVTNVTINNIKNPSVKGGTGNFLLLTTYGDQIIDDNHIFGVIGIAGQIGKLTSTEVTINGPSYAGQDTYYNVKFKTAQFIPWKSYIKFTLPAANNFKIAHFPSCFAYEINGWKLSGKLTCEARGNDIIITGKIVFFIYCAGLADDIPATTEVGMTIAVRNPVISQMTGSFKLAIYRQGTQMIYDWKTGIPGVSIAKGLMQQVRIVPVNPN
jgi:hypothetical protein